MHGYLTFSTLFLWCFISLDHLPIDCLQPLSIPWSRDPIPFCWSGNVCTYPSPSPFPREIKPDLDPPFIITRESRLKCLLQGPYSQNLSIFIFSYYTKTNKQTNTLLMARKVLFVSLFKSLSFLGNIQFSIMHSKYPSM